MKSIFKIVIVVVISFIIVQLIINKNESKVLAGSSLSEKAQIKKLYGNISIEKYITGRFNPTKHKKFVSLKKYGIPVNQRNHYLRIEVVEALKKLLADFKKDHPAIEIKIISSTRNFYQQKNIWDAKWTGKRKVDGKRLSKIVKNPLKRALKILRFSSMPGTSRHHWGTDFDINSLENSYFSKGNGKIIFNWFRKNGSKYGFVQPYTENRDAGYEEERWHWSYVPLARHYYKAWMDLYSKKTSDLNKKSSFKGAKDALKLAPIYVSAINNDCY